MADDDVTNNTLSGNGVCAYNVRIGTFMEKICVFNKASLNKVCFNWCQLHLPFLEMLPTLYQENSKSFVM